MVFIVLTLAGCAATPLPSPPNTVTLKPGEQVVQTSTLMALRAQIAALEKVAPVTAACVSEKAEVASLTSQLADARAGDPGYQKLETRVNELQSRLTQSQQRETDLRKKLNELVQIEKNARLPQGH
jgi:predicted RNase H-like nuclease (RuvC/YqgF family)